MKILILGDGLLGKEIQEQTGWDYISRKKDNFDFREITTYDGKLEGYDTIVNCIAHTETYSENKEKHWDVNYKGFSQLVDECIKTNKKLIHISTDYIYSNSVPNASEDDVPVHCRNWYGYTKLLSDAHIQLMMEKYLLVRCSFKPNPFPYDKALINQVGNFDSVDEIAERIITLINKECIGVFNVGTELKTIFDLARMDCSAEPVNTMLHPTMPTDVSMNTEKTNKELL